VCWVVLTHRAAFCIALASAGRRSNRDQALAIVLLRPQVRLRQRQRPRPPRLTRAEQLTLAALAVALARLAAGPRRRLDHCVLLCKPETILMWHRELVRRKWTYRRGSPGGRPPIPAEIEARILRLA
jgi:putative transposase